MLLAGQDFNTVLEGVSESFPVSIEQLIENVERELDNESKLLEGPASEILLSEILQSITSKSNQHLQKV